MNKIKVFNQLQNEVKNLETSVLEMQNNIKDSKSKMNNLIREILIENIEEVERCVVKWVLNNPIEAISYYVAKELKTAIYYKDDNKHTELFNDDNINYNYGYNLINVSTSKNIKITNHDICDYYSNLSCNGFLELDFLNNYKIELIKETGHFRNECDWSIKYKILNSKIYNNIIYKIIKNNFIINQFKIKKDGEIQLSKENVENLISQYESELELSYNDHRTFAIYDKTDLVGFISLNIYKDAIGNSQLEIESFEILEKYKGSGLGSKVVNHLKNTYNLDITGYSKPKDNAINFWSINGAEFDSCKNCEENSDCDGFECDKPLDYCFIIPVD